jgi:hypothetical protein
MLDLSEAMKVYIDWSSFQRQMSNQCRVTSSTWSGPHSAVRPLNAKFQVSSWCCTYPSTCLDWLPLGPKTRIVSLSRVYQLLTKVSLRSAGPKTMPIGSEYHHSVSSTSHTTLDSVQMNIGTTTLQLMRPGLSRSTVLLQETLKWGNDWMNGSEVLRKVRWEWMERWWKKGRKADVSILKCKNEVEPLVENTRSVEHPQAWLHAIPGSSAQRQRTYQALNLVSRPHAGDQGPNCGVVQSQCLPHREIPALNTVGTRKFTRTQDKATDVKRI